MNVVPKTCSQKCKDELLITKTRHLNDFRAFLGVGRCKNLGLLKFFPRQASSLCRSRYIYKAQNASSFSPSCFPLRVHWWWATAVANVSILIEMEWHAPSPFPHYPNTKENTDEFLYNVGEQKGLLDSKVRCNGKPLIKTQLLQK